MDTVVEQLGDDAEPHENPLRPKDHPTVLERDADIQNASANFGLGSDANTELPVSLGTRYGYIRELVPANPLRRIVIASSVTTNTQYVIKLVTDRDRLTPTALVTKDAVAIGDLILPIEQGDSGSGGGYEVQPLVSGETLAHWFATKDLSDEKAVKTLLHALNSLIQELRALPPISGRAGTWCHCDIKPENIIVESTDPLRLKLIDFGSAVFLEGLTTVQQRGRTIAYSAPELAHGVVHKNSDTWSIGMIVYQAILGRHPLNAEGTDHNLEASCRIQMSNGWESSAAAGVMGEKLGSAIDGMLTAAPSERWSHDDLTAFLAGDVVTNQPRQRDAVLAAENRPTFDVLGVECKDAAMAAKVMVTDWSRGVDVLGSSAFQQWLKTGLGRRDLADAVSTGTTTDGDLALLRFAYWACPSLPPVWKKQSLARNDLVPVAHQFLIAHSISRKDLQEIRDALQFLATVRGGVVPNDDCAGISLAWRTIESDIREMYRAIVAAGASLAAMTPDDQLAAISLQLACDPNSIAPLRSEVALAFQDNVPRQSWFYHWGTDASSLTTAQVCVLRSLSEASVANSGMQNVIPMGDQVNRRPVKATANTSPPVAEVVRLTYRFGFGSNLT